MSDDLSDFREELSEVSYGVDQIKEEIIALRERMELLERKRRSDRLLSKVWQRNVDELTKELFKDDPAKMLALGARLTEYMRELKDSWGIMTAELEAANCSDEAEDAGEEEEVDVDDL